MRLEKSAAKIAAERKKLQEKAAVITSSNRIAEEQKSGESNKENSHETK